MIPRMLTPLAVALLVPAALWAQTPASEPELIPESAAPAEVNQALRERVTEFMNYHKGTINRRGLDLVAEESKDAYYESGKASFKDFSIVGIEYFSKDFARAVVKTDVLRDMQVEAQVIEGTSTMTTHWKLENGKWVWFLDLERLWINPIASVGANPVRALVAEAFLQQGGQLTKDFNTPEAMAGEADKILNQAKLDKNAVTFTIGTAGQDRVVLQNGYTGYVDLKLSGVPDVPGLKVTLENSALKPHENGVVVFQYDPPVDATPEPQEISVRIRLDPFVQYFPIKLTLLPAAK